MPGCARRANVKDRAPVPDDVRRFIVMSIPSVPYAEAALLLRQKPDTVFTLQDVASALYTSERTAAELLDRLCADGVLQRDAERFQYAPRDAQLAAAWDRFAVCYTTNLIGVTQLIHDATQKSAHRFADAFRLRKDS
jgi:hypothetical protein